MNVSELIENRFGILTRANPNPLVDEVMIARTQILSNNPNRLGWIAVNLSPQNIWLAMDMNVSAAHGILLTANGGSVSLIYEEDFEATCWEVFAVAAADNSDIFVLEVVIAQ